MKLEVTFIRLSLNFLLTSLFWKSILISELQFQFDFIKSLAKQKRNGSPLRHFYSWHVRRTFCWKLFDWLQKTWYTKPAKNTYTSYTLWLHDNSKKPCNRSAETKKPCNRSAETKNPAIEVQKRKNLQSKCRNEKTCNWSAETEKNMQIFFVLSLTFYKTFVEIVL